MSYVNLKKLAAHIDKEYKKNHLILGTFENGYIISSGTIMAWFSEDYTPNKVKAIIAEYAGFIPNEYTGIACVAKGSEIEYLEPTDGRYKVLKQLLEMSMADKTRYIKTPMVFGNISVLQNTKDLSFTQVRTDIIDIIDPTLVNYDYEGDPTGPMASGELTGLFYTNTSTKVLMMPMRTQDKVVKGILDMLTVVDIDELIKG